MIVLDTNILSELMEVKAVGPVRNWLERVQPDDLFTTAVNEAEIRVSIAILPVGQRKAAFDRAAERMLSEDFLGRILPVDSAAARHFADIMAMRRRRGRPIETPDAMIAAIARAHGATVATRNVPDFEGCGLTLYNPWGQGD